MRRSFAEAAERHLGLRTAELPRGMAWIYAAAAVLSTPVLSRDVFVVPSHVLFEVVAGNVLPFVVVPAALHAAYRHAMPDVLARATSAAQRVLAHVVVSACTAALSAVVLRSGIAAVGWRVAPLAGVIAMNVVMTWAFLFPAKLVLAWRERSHASDLAAARNELYAIQSRAHPHFLFNAINTVASLIPEDPRSAEETLVRFADVLRYILETSTVPSTPLAEDVAILREYLEIQRARFEHLHYSIEVEAGLDGVRTPPLLLLPLVENAVLHGVASQRDAANVSVRIRHHGDGLSFDVVDDGPGPGGSSRQGTGTALRDLRRRLELLYGGRAEIVSGRNGGRGHAVSLQVPLDVDGALFS